MNVLRLGFHVHLNRLDSRQSQRSNAQNKLQDVYIRTLTCTVHSRRRADIRRPQRWQWIYNNMQVAGGSQSRGGSKAGAGAFKTLASCASPQMKFTTPIF